MEEKTLTVIRIAVGLTVAMLYWPNEKNMTRSEIEKSLCLLLDGVGKSWLSERQSVLKVSTKKLRVVWRGEQYWFSKEDISALAHRCIPPKESYLCLHD